MSREGHVLTSVCEWPGCAGRSGLHTAFPRFTRLDPNPHLTQSPSLPARPPHPSPLAALDPPVAVLTMLVKDESRSTRTVSRSGSLLGTIKGLWPAKLFGWSGDSPDTPGKRKGVEESYEAEEGQRSSKRQRVGGSPVRETTQPQVPQRQPLQLAPLPTSASGYLEPPGNFFGPTNAAAASRQGGHVRATSLAPSTRPLQATGSLRGLTAGPSTGAQPLGRTMSMDPPNRYRPNYGASKPMPLSRDVSMDDGSFEKALSTSPTLPFRMRTSLTPQPSGVAFGPEPPRRERNGSEPPPLAQLIDKPVFVKAPSETPRPKPSTSQAPATLGALAEAQRTVRSIHKRVLLVYSFQYRRVKVSSARIVRSISGRIRRCTRRRLLVSRIIPCQRSQLNTLR